MFDPVGLSFGAGVPPGKPDVPALYVWRDEASGAEVVGTYETGYGSDSVVFVLPNGVALAVCWYGDNRGPPTLEFVSQTITDIKKTIGQDSVQVIPSTFDAFFEVANQPTVKAQLPVVTAELGDG